VFYWIERTVAVKIPRYGRTHAYSISMKSLSKTYSPTISQDMASKGWSRHGGQFKRSSFQMHWKSSSLELLVSSHE
jgi:hypothetical protein